MVNKKRKIIDFAVIPTDHRMNIKETKKRSKYTDGQRAERAIEVEESQDDTNNSKSTTNTSENFEKKNGRDSNHEGG